MVAGTAQPGGAHGGPTGASFHRLTGGPAPLVRYTGCFIYTRGEGGEWTAPVAGDDTHLDEVPDATADGMNSEAEQTHRA